MTESERFKKYTMKYLQNPIKIHFMYFFVEELPMIVSEIIYECI